jgi:DNA polymerase-4
MLKRGATEDIRALPAVIAGDPKTRTGIILAKSELAKKSGIRTGETLVGAKRKCRNLHIFPPNHEMYARYSDEMFALLSEYSDVIEKFSIDECWLDYTASRKLFGEPVEAAYKLKERIFRELGFTVNIGVSSNKLLSKMGSELEKPDKVHTLFPREIEAKMWPLPVSELFFIGRATARKLAPLGIKTIGDLAHTDESLLQSLLKPAMGKLVHEYANGIDNEPVTPNSVSDQKGIGHATTTDHDITDMEDAKKYLLALSDRVSARLRKLGSYARVVRIQIRRSDMSFSGKQHNVGKHICATDEIYAESVKLLRELWKGEPLRLIGVSVTDFDDTEAEQLSLLDTDDYAKSETIDKTVDKIREVFGDDAITRGTLLSGDIRAGKK